MELTDVIRDKVRKALVLSLPPEKLDDYIKEEWEDFFDKDKRDYPSKTDFQLLLQEEIKARIAKGLKKWMDENFTQEWNGHEQKLLGDMVKKFTPIVMQELSTSLASAALSMIHQRLQLQ